MILYHGTSSNFIAFNEDYFGRVSQGPQNRLMGIWTSLTPTFPMTIADEVLVLHVDSVRMLHISSDVFRNLSSDAFGSNDRDDEYVHPSAHWRASGYDLVAATEPNGSIGDIIVLNPHKTTVLERVSSNDVERLIELEIEHWDDLLMSQRSGYVDALSATVGFKLAM
jgi:hypothetical protein